MNSVIRSLRRKRSRTNGESREALDYHALQLYIGNAFTYAGFGD